MMPTYTIPLTTSFGHALVLPASTYEGSTNRGPQNGPQYTMILFIRTPKKDGVCILGAKRLNF